MIVLMQSETTGDADQQGCSVQYSIEAGGQDKGQTSVGSDEVTRPTGENG